MTSIKLQSIAYYHPETVVTNQHYVDHFDKQGKDVKTFLSNVMGRKERYVIRDSSENGITMAVHAIKRALQKAEIKENDIDMIIYSSQTPEVTFPLNACVVGSHLGVSSKVRYLDTNANCIGMLTAVDQASRTMMTDKRLNTVVVVGSDYVNAYSDKLNEVTYGNFGDASVAVVLTKSTEKGFIDSIYYSDLESIDKVRYPREPMSKLVQEGVYPKSLEIEWLPFDGDRQAIPPSVGMIKELLEDNGLLLEDIDHYCLSQFSKGTGEKLVKALGQDQDRIIYVGDKFGYTATSSPFLALAVGIETGKVNRGDLVLLWSVGVGMQLAAVLFKV